MAGDETVRPRVLLIEDDEAIGQVLMDLLADEGFAVRWARHGREGLDVLARWLPRVILLDLMMPVMDGWAFRAAQRALAGPEAQVPVVVLSGAHEARARAASLDAAAVVTKPFDLDDLLATVHAALAVSPKA